jgi:hypothetical protein
MTLITTKGNGCEDVNHLNDLNDSTNFENILQMAEKN